MKKDQKIILEKNYFSNSKNYFFSIFNDRFINIDKILKKTLEKKYKKKFEPINILNFNYKTNIKNFVLFDSLGFIHKIIDYDYLNLEFSKSKKIKKIIDNLIKKQDIIFVNSFTSYGLDIESYNKKIKNIGQDGEIIKFLDNKINQLKIFKKNKLNIIDFKILNSLEKIEEYVINNQKKLPLFLSLDISHGSSGNCVVRNVDDFNVFKKKIKLNKDGKNKFFISKYIENVKLSPSSQALVCGKNDTRVLAITDQILKDGIKFEGNIYPSKSSKKVKKEILQMTEKIGNYLSKIGFFGYFGCDFIVDKDDNVYIVELNPRRTAPYMMVLMAMAKKNINLLECELNIEMNDPIPDFTYDDCQVDFCWAHKKIISDSDYVKIKKEVYKNSENYVFDNIGEIFQTNYFKKNHIIKNHIYGYVVVTGYKYDEVLNKLNKESEKLKTNTLEEIDAKGLKKKNK